MKRLLCISLLLVVLSCSISNNQTEAETTILNQTYFPPINSNTWETTPVSDLAWNTLELDDLYLFLNNSNTKGFIILHKGKIVMESYFNNHTENSNWYWASAGKTLTTAVTGIAQDEGILNINNKVSHYLETGWTNAPLTKENLITCKSLLAMSSGLDDTLGDSVTSSNLQYVADAETRWAYHNVYVKLQDVVEQASNTNWDIYFEDKLKNKIGMSGSWNAIGDLNIYFSNTRSMARFGLLIAANGKWEDTQIISQQFLNEATNTSQNINEAYGYLWWLNGKSSYHLPQTQYEFTGKLIPNAPDDMYCALGKNDQKIYIVPSKDLVIVRMGEAANNSNFALSNYDNELWEKINGVIQ